MHTRKGQGSFEYILMLAGVVMVVVLVILIVQGNISSSNNVLSRNLNSYNNFTNVSRIFGN